jgi:hypothetical protein
MRYRPTDPDTSRDAARSVSGDSMAELHAVILAVLVRATRPLCDADIHTALRYRYPERQWSPSGVRTRRSELVRDGYVRDSGFKTVLPTGRYSVAWEPVRVKS